MIILVDAQVSDRCPLATCSSITQKDQGTYRRVLEGADVRVMWSNVMEETEEPGESDRTMMGDHCPNACPGRRRDYDIQALVLL